MTTTLEIHVTEVLSDEQYRRGLDGAGKVLETASNEAHRRGLDQEGRELGWARDEAQTISEIVAASSDEAYGLRRSGEPFAPASSGTSDPTQRGAFTEAQRVQEVRGQLRELTSEIRRLLTAPLEELIRDARPTKDRLREIRKLLERPKPRGSGKPDVPTTPPLIDPTEDQR